MVRVRVQIPWGELAEVASLKRAGLSPRRQLFSAPRIRSSLTLMDQPVYGIFPGNY